ncbi:MAG: hypothetical protein J6K16_02815 [Alphaproteobacteria bacterium]|nr:hypothetical protein [Alphaproteobacteria bacterium]
MEQRLIDEATEKFVAVYKKTPKECGLTEIGIYEKQNAFLYAHSKEEIVAYKTCQNIIRWMMVWYLWPLALTMIVLIFCALPEVIAGNWLSIAFVGPVAFFVMWVILFLVLAAKALHADRISRDRVVWINY